MSQAPQTPANEAPDDEQISLLYVLTSALRDEAGFTEADACRIAEGMLFRISKVHGGRYFYVGTAASRKYIREKVRSAFNGHNHVELAAEYGVHLASVYRWVA